MPVLSGNNPQYSVSKNIRLFAGWGATADAVERVEIENLQEIPDLSNTTGETEKIEITTLKDEYHEYTDGLKNYADDSELSFKFLYSPEEYKDVYDLVNDDDTDGKWLFWFVILPDGSEFTIKSKSTFFPLSTYWPPNSCTWARTVVSTGSSEQAGIRYLPLPQL